VALATAMDTFDAYAKLHARKGTVAGYQKALANAELAQQMDEAFNACA
jgi:hypothetical protein